MSSSEKRPSNRGAGLIALQGSKSVQKRQREEEASEAVDKKARLLRQEMRRRGHIKIPRCACEIRTQYSCQI